METRKARIKRTEFVNYICKDCVKVKTFALKEKRVAKSIKNLFTLKQKTVS